MRWVTYRTGGDERAGLVVDDQIHALPAGTSVVGLLGDDGEHMAAAAERARSDPHEVIELAGADLAPALRPRQLRDYLCFLQHLRNVIEPFGLELDDTYTQIPAGYFSCISTLLGPHDDVAIPPGCEQFDFELEIGAVIGRGGSDIAVEDAWGHIAGYVIFSDWSARDVQLREMGLNLGPNKGKDGGSTLGPMFVTADELEPYRSGESFSLGMRAYVNDELVGGGSMDQMDWYWPDVVVHASRGCILLPGDVLGSGTVPTGCLLELASLHGSDFRGYLQPGDVVRLEVDQLGELRQRVVAGPEPRPMRALAGR